MSDYNIGAKVKQLRLARKMTLQAVASATGFSPALISQIEHENVSPPIATLAKLARLFDIGIGQFFAEDDVQERYEVVRAGSRGPERRNGLMRETICGRLDRRMKPSLLRLDETAVSYLTDHLDCEKFLFIVQGSARLHVDGEEVELNEGDSVYLDPQLGCGLASGGSPATVLAVAIPRLKR